MGLSIQDLGAFGVMSSLIYVGLQIKQTRNVVMAESEASFAQSTSENYFFIAEHRHIAEMIAKERGRDPDELMLNFFWAAIFFPP